MTICYINNTTGQHMTFWYRVPGITRPVSTTVKPYEQVPLYKDADKSVLNSIIDQLTVFGLIDESTLDHAEKKIGFLYRFDKPVATEKIDDAVDIVDAVRDDQALELRKATAAGIAADNVEAMITEVPRDPNIPSRRSERFTVVGQTNADSPSRRRA